MQQNHPATISLQDMKLEFLNSDELAQFEYQYGRNGLDALKRPAVIDGQPVCDYAVIEEGRKLSIHPSLPGAPDLITVVPRLLAWGDADSFLDLVQCLDYQVAGILLHQALDDIEEADPKVSRVMRDLLEKLPAWAAVRFTVAPATRRRVALLREDPAAHAAFLYRSLKAELRLSGEAVSGEGCWTALGDFYVTEKDEGFVDPLIDGWVPDKNLRAPRLHGVVPVDALSPNVRDINAPPLPYLLHNAEELAGLGRTLENVMTIAESAARTAGQIIKRFVKVIVALKTATGGPGSSSHYSVEGQIVLRNSHKLPEGRIVTALVHEAIHQVIYVLESGKRFVDDRASSGRATVASAWTDRQLAIHSYLHACFVWYGLATFWRRALHSALLPADVMQAELDEALRGFRSGNPADRLLPYRDMICPEALQSVASLRDELGRAGELEGQSMLA
jgi:HEXXH motif-containing protein